MFDDQSRFKAREEVERLAITLSLSMPVATAARDSRSKNDALFGLDFEIRPPRQSATAEQQQLPAQLLQASETVRKPTRQEVKAEIARWDAFEPAEIPKQDAQKRELTAVERNVISLELWRQYAGQFPILAAAARHVLCVPATACDVEGLWSRAGVMSGLRRSRLTPPNLCAALFLNGNRDHW